MDVVAQQLVLSLGMFVLGYIVAKVDTIVMILKRHESDSFVSSVTKEQKSAKKRKVEIDDKTYVTDVSTDGMQSLGASLGTVSQSNDDITAASSKLAQMKKRKG